MAGWIIPTAKTSSALEKSLLKLKEGVDCESPKVTEGLQHSTPVITKLSKKDRRGKRNMQNQGCGLKDRTLKMLDEMDL